jgi:hypothetical protein
MFFTIGNMTNESRGKPFRQKMISAKEAVFKHKRYIFICMCLVAVGIFFLGPSRTFYAWDKAASFVRIPVQRIFPAKVHPWGHFASTSPITAHEIINGIEVPPLPTIAEGIATFEGVDNNQDGLRDEIERYIAKRYGNEKNQYLAIREYVRTAQIAMAHTESREAFNASVEINHCFPRKSGDRYAHDTFNTLQFLYFMNTDARAKAFLDAFSSRVSPVLHCEKFSWFL